MDRVAEGIWRWSARHPEWHPRTSFGAEVASYAIHDGTGTMLIDPLARDDRGFVDRLDAVVTGRVRIIITIPYHVRSAEQLWARYRAGHGATILGHAAVAKRLTDVSGFEAIEAGSPLDGGILPMPIGNPRRYETPLFVPEHRAVIFGDAIVESEGALRVWVQRPITSGRLDWYARRLRPTLQRLLDMDLDRVLVTHGEPVLADGGRALAAALDAGPWYHRPN